MNTLDYIVIGACGAILLVYSTLMFGLFLSLARRLRRHFDATSSKLYELAGRQEQRVDGMVKQYRDVQRRVKTWDRDVEELVKSLAELDEYVHGELSEQVGEVDLTMSAILDGEDEDDPETWPVYVEPTKTQTVTVPQPKTPKTPKPTGGLGAVDAAAKKPAKSNGTNGTYSRYQELRDQGYSAAEATAMIRNGSK